MFLKTIEVAIEKTRRSRHNSKKLIVCVCDQCGIEYSKKYTLKDETKSKESPTFCSRSCLRQSQKLGGLVCARRTAHRDNVTWQENLRKTMNERYGVDYAYQMSDHAEKCRRTIQKNYGEQFNNGLQLPHARQAMLRAISSDQVIEKRKETNRRKWGHENVFGSEAVKSKIKEALTQSLGVDHPSKSPIVIRKREETCASRYGYKTMILTPESRAAARETCLMKYGAVTYWQSDQYKTSCRTQEYRRIVSERMSLLARSPDFQRRRHETMKRNGSYGKSRLEDELYERLFHEFPDVQRQVVVNGWSIDFYIPSIDVYIQFDGTYWHGLNRSPEVIASSSHPRDKVILETMSRDTKQDSWFSTNKKQLLRFNDRESFDDIIKRLLTRDKP